MAKQKQVAVPRKGRNASRCPFTLREKVEALAKVKLHGEDAAEVLGPLYKAYKRPLPKYPAQSMSSWILQFERLTREGDKEALALAKKLGFEFAEVEAGT